MAKLRTTPQRKAKQNVECAQKISDDESNASSSIKLKRTRSWQRLQNTAVSASEETGNEAEKESDFEDEADSTAGKATTSGTPTRSPSKRVKKSIDYSYEISSDNSESNTGSSDKGRKHRTPVRRKIFARGSSAKSSPSTSALNGSARTTAKQGSTPDGDDRYAALIHALKINTAMMGDLAAELRMFRDTLFAMNRGR